MEYKGFKKNIRLLALDVDGTLFNSDGKIVSSSLEAICAAQNKGVQVVVASGRNFDGLPWDQLKYLAIDYVITTNGSSVYRVKDRKCLYEECLDFDDVRNAVLYCLNMKVYVTVFISGECYTPEVCIPFVDNMAIPDYLKVLLRGRKNKIADVYDFFNDKTIKVQKVTLNFQSLSNGEFLNRDSVKTYLEQNINFNVVDGGFSNLEFTKAGISKGSGLIFLSDFLGISLDQTMSIGDSGNDLDMIRTSGIGIAMGNAEKIIKDAADDITLGNDENGITFAINKYIFS